MLLIFFSAVELFSCRTTTKLLYRTQYHKSRVSYYVTKKPKPSKGSSVFYARVDSGNIVTYYSFWVDKTFKTYSDNKNYVYTLVSDKSPMILLTDIDNIVLAKANHLIDSLYYRKLKSPEGATGFDIEIAGH